MKPADGNMEGSLGCSVLVFALFKKEYFSKDGKLGIGFKHFQQPREAGCRAVPSMLHNDNAKTTQHHSVGLRVQVGTWVPPAAPTVLFPEGSAAHFSGLTLHLRSCAEDNSKSLSGTQHGRVWPPSLFPSQALLCLVFLAVPFRPLLCCPSAH